MTPDQIAAINAVAMVLERVGSWPLGSLFFGAVVAPWVVMWFVSRGQDRRLEAMKQMFGDALSVQEGRFREATSAQEKRFESVAKMYENNVELVRSFEKMAQSYRETVVWNASVMQEVKDTCENNLFCPWVRKGSKPKDIEVPR